MTTFTSSAGTIGYSTRKRKVHKVSDVVDFGTASTVFAGPSSFGSATNTYNAAGLSADAVGYGGSVLTAGGSAASGNSFKIISLPQNAVLLACGLETLVVDTAGNSATLALTDGTNTFIAAATMAALTSLVGTATAYPRIYYASAAVAMGATSTNWLQVNIGTGTINGKYRVWAVIVDAGDEQVTQRNTFT